MDIKYKSRPLIIYTSFGAVVLFGALTYICWAEEVKGWECYSSLSLFVLSVFGLFDSLYTLLEIRGDSLIVRRLFKGFRLNRADILKVAVEKGCSMKIMNHDAEAFTLPELAVSQQELKKVIHKWQKK